MSKDILTPEEREAVESGRNCEFVGADVHRRHHTLIAALDRLAPKPEPMKVWVNWWKSPDGQIFLLDHASKEDAHKDSVNTCGLTYLGCHALTFGETLAPWEPADVR